MSRVASRVGSRVGSRVLSRVGGFSPLTLSPILWLDPYDKSTLFQDAAGTTPVTADGDPVGLWMDKSGNGNHFSQSTTAAKPTYRESGGLAWLEFDGVDDFLLLSGALVSTSAVTIVAGARYATEGYLINQNSGAFSSYRTFTNGTQSVFRSTGNTGAGSANSAVTAPVTDVYTVIGDTVNDVCVLRSGGVERDSDGQDQGGGDYAGANDTTIGRRSAGTSYLDGNAYGFIVCDRVLPTYEIEAGEQYMAGKTGVTL